MTTRVKWWYDIIVEFDDESEFNLFMLLYGNEVNVVSYIYDEEFRRKLDKLYAKVGLSSPPHHHFRVEDKGILKPLTITKTAMFLVHFRHFGPVEVLR